MSNEVSAITTWTFKQEVPIPNDLQTILIPVNF